MLLEKGRDLLRYNLEQTEEAQRVPLTAKRMHGYRSKLPNQPFSGNTFYTQVLQRFRSWEEFWTEVGFDISTITKIYWSYAKLREKGLEILAYNEQQADQALKVPMESVSAMKKFVPKIPGQNFNGFAFYYAVTRHFPSWHRFWKSSDLHPKIRFEWSKGLLLSLGEEVLEYNARFTDGSQRIAMTPQGLMHYFSEISPREFKSNVFYSTVRLYCGSWKQFLTALQLNSKEEMFKWTPEKVLNKAKELLGTEQKHRGLVERLFSSPGQMRGYASNLPRQDFTGNAYYQAIRKHFGSWNAFLVRVQNNFPGLLSDIIPN